MIRLTLSLLFALMAAMPAAAQVLDEYVARIGAQDHFNSNGVRLTDPAAIIRQDRANLYVFGKGDWEDETDTFFRSRENRALMERMLRNGSSAPGAVRAIVNGTPLILVRIYENRIEVTVLD